MSFRKTVLKSTIVIISLTVLMNLFCISSLASEVILYPSSKTVSVGDTFTVDVFVKPDAEITGMQFDLEYDNSMVSIEKVEEKELFIQSGMSTIFNEGTIETGILRNVYGCILGDKSVSTPATFARITLYLGEENSDTLNLDLKNVVISDSEGNSLSTITTGIAIDINENNTSQKPGDYDQDHDVDFDDFVEFAGVYNSRAGDGKYEPFFDFDNDMDVDFSDFVEFAGFYEN